MSHNPKDIQWYLDQLKSEECYCGRKKKPRFALCYGCYKALYPETKKALYRPVRGGFEEAFEEAIAELDDAGRI